MIEEYYKQGITDVNELWKIGHAFLSSKKCQLEYINFCDFTTGEEILDQCQSNTLVSASIKFSNCRIIDNILIS